MNKSFNFFTPTQLLFGPGRLEDLKDIAPKYGSKCLLVSRPLQGSLKSTYKRVEKLLNSANIEVAFFDEIIPKPCSLILVLSSISKVEREGNTAVLMEHLSLIT